MKKENQSIDALREVPVSSECIFDGTVLHVYRDGILLPDGKPAHREYIKHVGAVCVVPLTAEGEVICVRQYRYPFSDVLLEIPAGKLDAPTEDPFLAAKRELKEETGADCERMTYLGKYFGSPALIGETIHMYLAEGLTFGSLDLDEDEFLEVERIPLDTLVKDILAGNVPDGKTQAAVLRVAMMKQGSAVC